MELLCRRMDEDGLEVEREGHAQLAGRPIPARRQWTPLGRALTVAGDNWTLLIAVQLQGGRLRVSELRSRLAGVSTGVLDRYLRQMASAGLLTRTRFREMPPRVELELTDAGRELLPIAAALARWGLRRAWSEPEDGEQVDIHALLRLLPVLLAGPTGLPDADIELILHEGVAESRYHYLLREGRLLPTDRPLGAAPSVRIRGDSEAWRAALGPEVRSERLRVGGEQAIARALLEALHRPDPPARAEGEVA
jgi:DNA-binding HxlR family transcriptional regulator